MGVPMGNLRTRTGKVGIVGLIVGTFIGKYCGTGIVCSGVGIGLGVEMTGGACGCVLQELNNGFHCTCCSVPIISERELGFRLT